MELKVKEENGLYVVEDSTMGTTDVNHWKSVWDKDFNLKEFSESHIGDILKAKILSDPSNKQFRIAAIARARHMNAIKNKFDLPTVGNMPEMRKVVIVAVNDPYKLETVDAKVTEAAIQFNGHRLRRSQAKFTPLNEEKQKAVEEYNKQLEQFNQQRHQSWEKIFSK